MRVLLFAQVAAVALLVSGCPGAPASDPTGGGNCAPGKDCSATGGSGGEGNSAANGSGGFGNGGVGGSGNSGTGGSNSGGSGNGSGGAGNGSGGAGNGSGGAGSGSSGSGSGGDPAVCEPLKVEIAISLGAAQVCNLEVAGNSQCKYILDGPCCQVAVNNINSPDVQAYLEALKAYQQAGCVAACPPEPCPMADKGTCTPSGGSNGTCVINP